MRFLEFCALLLCLAACEARGTSTAAGAATAPLMGNYRAASDAARQIAGDVAIERGGLAFSKGLVLYTRVLNPRSGGDVVARGGDSYAAIALGAAELSVELRRVTEEVNGDAATGLCAGEATSYVALAYEGNAATVTIMAFAGEEAPGPEATNSKFCGAFVYEAPDGARTRQGVLLF